MGVLSENYETSFFNYRTLHTIQFFRAVQLRFFPRLILLRGLLCRHLPPIASLLGFSDPSIFLQMLTFAFLSLYVALFVVFALFINCMQGS